MPSSNATVRLLAETYVAGPRTTRALNKLLRSHLPRPWQGLPALTRRFLAFEESIKKIDISAAWEFLRQDQGLCEYLHLRKPLAYSPGSIDASMRPHPAASSWKIKPLTSLRSLADWLRLPLEELSWFAGYRFRASSGKLSHYSYQWIPKRSGGCRLIEKPKEALKQIQRRILAEVLDPMTPHDAVTSYRRGFSIIDHTKPHTDSEMVITMDIEDFYPSLTFGRARGLFVLAGYPDPIAELLAALCCASTPRAILHQAPVELSSSRRRRFQRPHLPQGAPTSGALSNLLGYRIDARLTGLASPWKLRYTRYADDLAFSGSSMRRDTANRFIHQTGAILLEESFTPNMRKTRVMRPSQRQRVTGLVVNERPNIDRQTWDRLKAQFYQCSQGRVDAHLPPGMNHDAFREHLLGQIAWVSMVHPGRGLKLKKHFDKIVWT